MGMVCSSKGIVNAAMSLPFLVSVLLWLFKLPFSSSECVNWCSQHGLCSGPEEDAFCICEMGWTDDGCSTRLCPKGDDPLTEGQNDRAIKIRTGAASGTLDGLLIFSFLGEQVELPASAAQLDTRACSLLISNLPNVEKAVCERGPINKNGGADYKVTFAAWPEAPWENNLHAHEGNPPLREFACDASQVTGDVSNAFCELSDLVASNVKEYVECGNRGACDRPRGQCVCEPGFKGAACADTSDTGDHFPVVQDGPFFTGTVMRVASKRPPSDAFTLLQVDAGAHEVLTLDGEGDLTLHRGKLTVGGGGGAGGPPALTAGPLGTAVAAAGNADALTVRGPPGQGYTQALLALEAGAPADPGFAALTYRAPGDPDPRPLAALDGAGSLTLRRGNLTLGEGALAVERGPLTATGGQVFEGGARVGGGLALAPGADLRVEGGGLAVHHPAGGGRGAALEVRRADASGPALVLEVEGGSAAAGEEGAAAAAPLLAARVDGRDVFSVDASGRAVAAGGVAVGGGGLAVAAGGVRVGGGGLRVEGGLELASGELVLADEGGLAVTGAGGLRVVTSGDAAQGRPPLLVRADHPGFLGTVLKVEAAASAEGLASELALLELSAGPGQDPPALRVDAAGAVAARGALRSGPGAPVDAGGDLTVGSRAVFAKQSIKPSPDVKIDPFKSTFIVIEDNGKQNKPTELIIEASGPLAAGQLLLVANGDADPAAWAGGPAAAAGGGRGAAAAEGEARAAPSLLVAPGACALAVWDGRAWAHLQVLEVGSAALRGVTALEAAADLHVGDHALGARALQATGQTEATVAFYGHGGLLSGTEDFSFDSASGTLTVPGLAVAGRVARDMDFGGRAALNAALVNCTLEGVAYLRARRLALEGAAEGGVLAAGPRGELLALPGLAARPYHAADGGGGEAALAVLAVAALDVKFMESSLDFKGNAIVNADIQGGKITGIESLQLTGQAITVGGWAEDSDVNEQRVVTANAGGELELASSLRLEGNLLKIDSLEVNSFSSSVDFQNNEIVSAVLNGGKAIDLSEVETQSIAVRGAAPSSVAFFTKDGLLKTDEEFTFLEGTLQVRRLGPVEITGSVDFAGSSVSNIAIVSGSIEDATIISTNDFVVKGKKRGSIPVFGDEGSLQTDEHLLFKNGVLEVGKISGHSVSGAVNFGGNALENAKLVSPSIDGLTELIVDQISLKKNVEKGQLLFSGDDGKLVASSDLTFNGAGELKVSALSGHSVNGPVNFKNNELTNVLISSGKITGLEELKAAAAHVGGALTADGDAYFGGAVTVAGAVIGSGPYIDSSDRRFKRDLAPVEGAAALAAVRRLRPVRYAHRAGEFPERRLAEGPQLGFVAQEVQEVFPEVVATDAGGYLAVAYGRLLPPVVAALGELARRVTVLTEEQQSGEVLEASTANSSTEGTSTETLQKTAELGSLRSQVKELSNREKEMSSTIEMLKAEIQELKQLVQELAQERR